MKKIICLFAILAALVSVGALADSYTYTTTVTNNQAIAYSDPLPISGFFDKAEITTETASTTTVTLATYSGTTALDTYVSLSGMNGTTPTKLVRTRVLGTDNTGSALAAAGNSTNVSWSTTVNVPYERPFIGGNAKVAVTGTANDGSCPVTVVIYYQPTQK